MRTDTLYQSFGYMCWVDEMKLCPQERQRCREDKGRTDWPGTALRNEKLNLTLMSFINQYFHSFIFNGLIILLGLLSSIRLYKTNKEVQLFVWIILLDQIILFFTTPAANRRYLLVSIFLSLMLIGKFLDEISEEMRSSPQIKN